MSAHAEPIGHGPAMPRITAAMRTSIRRRSTSARGSTRRSSASSSSSGRRSCSSARSSRSTSSTASSTTRPLAPPHPGHARAVRAAVVPGARQHVHPRHVELHDALGDAVDQARPPRRALRGDGADAPARARRSCSRRSSSTTGSASTRATRRSRPRSSGSRACTPATSSSG